ncbi:group II intron maturase-specific domain-containing protein [Mesorhizobium sp. M0220]|uniref:group II intron maturase-specific domain-containing protein n=1 Tax=Mesorhizobium sp. M0220 TaxID=2956920 RepID=UPI00333C7054
MTQTIARARRRKHLERSPRRPCSNGEEYIPQHTPGMLAEIAKQLNPLLRGWTAYYGRYSRSAPVHSG